MVEKPMARVACLDAPLMSAHTQDHYRAAIEATGDLWVHSHFGGRFERLDDGSVRPLDGRTDYPTFVRLAHQIAGFQGHIGYELCSPVLIGHRHAGLDDALLQAEWACAYMRHILDNEQGQA
jgi:hypothetical protein